MKAVLALAVALLIGGCSTFRFPGVHRITIQQGNVISQTMIDKLRPGMTRSQVRFILGNPVVDDSLDQTQWDYVYTIQIAGGAVTRRLLVLYFREERLSYFEGDFLPSDSAPPEKAEVARTEAD
jgi:outer membrane protein assembly factor BamE